MPKSNVKLVEFGKADMDFDLPAELDPKQLRTVGRGPEVVRRLLERSKRMVELDADVAAEFGDGKQVNDALRLVVQLRHIGKVKRKKSA